MVDQIVRLILSFIADFLEKLRLNRLKNALKAQEEKTNEAVKSANADYDAWKHDYDEWKRKRADLRPDAGALQSSSGEAAKSDSRNGSGESGPE